MLPIETARRILGRYSVITDHVEKTLRAWPDRKDSTQAKLEMLQKYNARVFPLATKVSKHTEWSDELWKEVEQFFQSERDLVKDKMGCLYEAGLSVRIIQTVVTDIYTELREERDNVCFLWADMYAFGAGGFPEYRAITEPVFAAFSNRLNIVPIDQTDSFRSHCEKENAIEQMLEFAKSLKKEVLETRVALGLPAAVNIGIGISYGKCKFNLVTGQPEPSKSTCVWTEAARLMYSAVALCEHIQDEGGVVVISDVLKDKISDRITAKMLSDFDANLKGTRKDRQVNILSK